MPNCYPCFWSCGQILDHGHNFAEKLQVRRLHDWIYLSFIFFDRSTKKAKVIQKAFRKYIQRKTSKSAETI
jgi:hypothetical protein